MQGWAGGSGPLCGSGTLVRLWRSYPNIEHDEGATCGCYSNRVRERRAAKKAATQGRWTTRQTLACTSRIDNFTPSCLRYEGYRYNDRILEARDHAEDIATRLVEHETVVLGEESTSIGPREVDCQGQLLLALVSTCSLLSLSPIVHHSSCFSSVLLSFPLLLCAGGVSDDVQRTTTEDVTLVAQTSRSPRKQDVCTILRVRRLSAAVTVNSCSTFFLNNTAGQFLFLALSPSPVPPAHTASVRDESASLAPLWHPRFSGCFRAQCRGHDAYQGPRCPAELSPVWPRSFCTRRHRGETRSALSPRRRLCPQAPYQRSSQ